jgi:hypothetical protein
MRNRFTQIVKFPELVTGKLPELANWDMGVIASTFKLFLFYLPEPLLAPDNGYDDLIQAASMKKRREVGERDREIEI